jgi:hypothetical protein
VLSSQQDLASHLREMLHTCLVSANDGGCNYNPRILHSLPRKDALLRTLQSPSDVPPLSSRITHLPLPGEYSPLKGRALVYPSCPHSPCTIDLSENGFVDIPTFVTHVRVACAYNLLLMLMDLAIPMSSLKGTCQFLLSSLTRESMIEFFRSVFLSRFQSKLPDNICEFPLFPIGGAGSHYQHTLVQRPRTESQPWTEQSLMNNSPLPVLSHKNDKDTDDRWLDIHDLSGYLHDNNIRLLFSPPDNIGSKPPPLMIDAISLLGSEFKSFSSSIYLTSTSFGQSSNMSWSESRVPVQ